MVDIEALSNRPNSVILTIGAQQFDPGSDGWITGVQVDTVTRDPYIPYLNIRVDVDEQILSGRIVDDKTLAWWGNQDPAAIDEAFNLEDRLPLSVALQQLSKLAYPCKRIWSKGPLYDITLLEDAYIQTRQHIPWKFWAIRDARTVYSLCPGLKSLSNGHVALDDCRNQIIMLQGAFKILGVEQLA